MKGDGSIKCLMITVFVFSKVIVQEILDKPATIAKELESAPESERTYLHAYGMTLIALMTDLFYSMFTNEL